MSLGAIVWAGGGRKDLSRFLIAAIVFVSLLSLVPPASAQSNSPPDSFIESPSEDVTVTVGESVTFNVGGYDQDGNLHGIEWYRNGDHVGNTYEIGGQSDTGSRTFSFDSPGTYSIEANVFDLETAYNDNAGEWVVTVESDNQAPKATADNPIGDQSISPGESIGFAVDADDADGNLAGAEWYVNDQFIEETSVIGSYSDTAIWEETFDDPGTYTVEAVIFDEQRAYSDAVEWTITVESTDYTPEIDREAPSSTSSIVPDDRLEFKITGSDQDSNLDGVEWYVDDDYVESTSMSGSSDTASFGYTFESQGTYSVEAVAFDSDSQYSEPVEWTVTVEETNAEPTLSRSAPAQTIRVQQGTTTSFEVTAADPNNDLAGVEWYLDDRFQAETSAVPAAGGESGWDYTFDETGTYLIEAEAFDDSRTYSDPVSWEVEVYDTTTALTVDRATPTTDSVSLTAGEEEPFEITATAEGAKLASADYKIDGETVESLNLGGTTASPTFTHQFSEPGSHTVSIRVQTDAGTATDTVEWTVDVTEQQTTKPTIKTVSPSTELQAEPGEELDFTVDAEAPSETLSEVEFEVEGISAADRITLSGDEDRASFAYEFATSGTYTVTAQAKTVEGSTSDPVQWEVTVQPDSNVDINGRGMYVWNDGGKVSTDDEYRDKLYDYIDEYDIQRIYLGWGASRNYPDQTADLVEALHQRGVEVHVVIATGTTDGGKIEAEKAIEYMQTQEPQSRFDGISFDVEDTEADQAYFDGYKDMLTTTEELQATHLERDIPISGAFGLWATNNPEDFQEVYQHPDLDYPILMAYRDENRATSNVIDDLKPETKPYVVALEAMKISPEYVSYYNHNAASFKDGLRFIEKDYEGGTQLKGTVIHFAGALQSWNAIEAVDVSKADDDTISVTAQFLFMEQETREYDLCLKTGSQTSECIVSEEIAFTEPTQKEATVSIDRTEIPEDQEVRLVLQDEWSAVDEPVILESYRLDIESLQRSQDSQSDLETSHSESVSDEDSVAVEEDSRRSDSDSGSDSDGQGEFISELIDILFG